MVVAQLVRLCVQMVYALQVILHIRAQSFLLVQQKLIDVWMGLAQTAAVPVLELVR